MFKRIALISLLTTVTGYCSAGVIVGGTRVIFDATKPETTLNIENPDNAPFLIQSWIDSNGIGDNLKNMPKAPFIVTPPLFRLESHSQNVLRIIARNFNFPGDRESLYWMNVKAIPTVDETRKNVLQFTFKTRVKFFYRPATLSKTRPEDFYGKLTFTRSSNKLTVKNPSPYYITFFKLNVNGQKIDTTNTILQPFNSQTYNLSTSSSGNEVSWQLINDYGGSSKKYEATVL